LVGDVGERSVAVVVVKNRFSVIGDKEVRPAVVVVIAGANADTISRVADSGAVGNVFKSSVAPVPV